MPNGVLAVALLSGCGAMNLVSHNHCTVYLYGQHKCRGQGSVGPCKLRCQRASVSTDQGARQLPLGDTRKDRPRSWMLISRVLTEGSRGLGGQWLSLTERSGYFSSKFEPAQPCKLSMSRSASSLFECTMFDLDLVDTLDLSVASYKQMMPRAATAACHASYASMYSKF